MSKTEYRQGYYCWNDCVPQGCPGHIAALQYQSVSEALTFKDGKGQTLYLQPPELGAFLDMVYRLSTVRSEIRFPEALTNGTSPGVDKSPDALRDLKREGGLDAQK